MKRKLYSTIRKKKFYFLPNIPSYLLYNLPNIPSDLLSFLPNIPSDLLHTG